MANVFTGKKVWVGVGLETNRGERANIAYWFPRTDNTFTDKIETENNEWNVWSIVDTIDTETTKQYAEWSIGGTVYPNGIGFFLKALLGAVATTGTGPVYEHVFTLLESNTHPSMTVGTVNPIGSYSYPLGLIESMEFSAELWGKLTTTINLKARKGESATHTREYLDEKGFVANMLKVYFADTIAWLDTADNICLQNITIAFSKNIQDVGCLSSIDPLDYINTSFSIEGSMELNFTDEQYKTFTINNIAKAMRLQAINDKAPIDWSNNPELRIDLSRVQFTDWTPSFAKDDIVKQSVNFKGHYDIWTQKAIEVYLKNSHQAY